MAPKCLYREFHQFLGKSFGISDAATQTAVDPVDYKHFFWEPKWPHVYYCKDVINLEKEDKNRQN